MKEGRTMISERIHFRLIQMPCCKHILPWVNSRLPNYCPECSQGVFTRLKYPKGNSPILISDEAAALSYTSEKGRLT